MSSTSVTGGAI